MKEWKFQSEDGIHEIRAVSWETEDQPRAILQISHGMQEYMERYGKFAEFLVSKGIMVVGNDHLGHGYSVNDASELGYFQKGANSGVVIEDLHTLTKAIKEQYPDVPYILMGHSMGSFMARRYLMTYGNELDAAIIMGTGTQPGAVLAGGKLVSKIIELIKGDKHRSTLMKIMAFGAYNKRIKPMRTRCDWLTKETEIVDWYRKNPLCTFSFTVNGYQVLFDAIGYIQKKSNIEKIPKDLPILIVSGEEDPVGAYGAGPKAVAASYQKAGIQDVTCILYPEDRHEILNETDKEKVYDDILNFIEKQVK